MKEEQYKYDSLLSVACLLHGSTLTYAVANPHVYYLYENPTCTLPLANHLFMELQLGLGLPPTHSLPHWLQPRKRTFEDAMANDPQTLPLLVWDTLQPSEKNHELNKDLEGGEVVVSWPPLKAQRKNLYSRYNAGTGSRYVKVKMEGLAIGRKIDVNTCRSLSTLKRKLFSMFAVEDDLETYLLTYQDGKGRWLSAENNEGWRGLSGSVQRLKLVKCTSY